MKRLIAEFEEQNFTQIIFPHENSDWISYIEDSEITFINIINAIIKYQKCLVICKNLIYTKSKFQANKNLYFVEYETDDTWARDSSALSIEDDGEIKLLDFSFNGWGDKFESKKDNAMSKAISKHYSCDMQSIDFILEGGGVESNGDKILLTTSTCLLNKNRNPKLNSMQITKKL
ncbi:MAG: agmatine deiminase, partial [Deltaproteobacteria bacterium]